MAVLMYIAPCAAVVGIWNDALYFTTPPAAMLEIVALNGPVDTEAAQPLVQLKVPLPTPVGNTSATTTGLATLLVAEGLDTVIS